MRFRSAITGRWVTRLFARRNPRTTVSEGKAKAPSEAMDCPYCATDLLED